MHIQRAKEEIKHTVQIYLSKDEEGYYEIPVIHQRPVLLMGPPGIGKTAIMEQIARECKIALVSYAMTHHTRQSAVGLPVVKERCFCGNTISTTEYTMSEIVASIYNTMEETGLQEGILFLDEINCVSETLAPIMLQLLQAKTFGTHRIPEGWVIVAAGNPSEYNKSVHEYDIVTRDRVKYITVEADLVTWRNYAYERNIHQGILSYLDIKKEHFYTIEATVDGTEFVTARGWEDLSRLMLSYEKQNIAITEDVIIQYLQHRRIAKEFAAYLDLYYKYEKEYPVQDILRGVWDDAQKEKMQQAAFDEKISIIHLLIAGLDGYFGEYREKTAYLDSLYGKLQELKLRLQIKQVTTDKIMKAYQKELSMQLEEEKKTGLLSREEERIEQRVRNSLYSYMEKAVGEDADDRNAFDIIKQEFQAEVLVQEQLSKNIDRLLEHAFTFVEKVFGSGQEMVIFITELTVNKNSMEYIRNEGCEKYYQYNRELLFQTKRDEIKKKIRTLSDEMVTVQPFVET